VREERPIPFVSNLGMAFEEVASRHASRAAFIYPGGGRFTYAELARLTGRIASGLHARGFREGDVAAIFHDKSPEAYAAMLACLRLGVLYTNLDPESPWERLRKILSNCAPRGLLNFFPKLPHAGSLAGGAVPEILDGPSLAKEAVAPEQLPGISLVTGGTPAYIMFTSGSTGQPKGAVMSHSNLLGFINWSRDRFEVTEEDVFTNVNPIFFDNSVFDFYTSIFSGAALVPVTPAQARDARMVVRAVGDAGCTIWFSVPSLLVYLLTTRALGADSFPAVRKIIFGGEGFSKPKLKLLFDLFGSRADLENVYGPTECTCICSAHKIGQPDFEDMQNLAALGQLAQNFSGDILPLDAADPEFGELFLRGPQVGLGYYNDPARTEQSFAQNPSHQLYRDIGYRTGDLVRRDGRGWLHFKGRADFQIKHMGYRIELEEIEAALNSLDGVRECAVIYQRLGDGLGQIVGFAAVDAHRSPEDLVSGLASLVPPYMVPRRVVSMAELPKNANGKIDRPALAASLKSGAAT